MGKMKFSGSAVFGIILIAVGIVSLLSGLNYFDSWYIFSTYWPLVIVLFGVKHMIDHRSSTMFGLILILVGAFLQLEQLNLWYFNEINVKELIVPVIIILIGLNFVLPRRRNDDLVEVKVTKTVEAKEEAERTEAKAKEPVDVEEVIMAEAVVDSVEDVTESTDVKSESEGDADFVE